MVYELPEYAEKIAKCCVNTLNKRIDKDLLPSNHLVYRGKKGKMTVIEIIHGSEHCAICSLYHHASIEYQKKKHGEREIEYNRELATSIVIKFDLSQIKFFAMQGLNK